MTAYRHWKLDRDADGIAWLSFDKAGTSTNTLSADVFEELRAMLAELATAPPKGLVIRSAKEESTILAIPVEESGQSWFTLQWGDAWLDHVRRIAPDYAKVLVRDNPLLPADKRRAQLDDLAQVSDGLRKVNVPLLYELLVPPMPSQPSSSPRTSKARCPGLR